MCGKLVFFEMKKLCEMRMLYVFVLLCIGFNGLLILGNQYGEDYVSYVKEEGQKVGRRRGDEFSGKALQLSDCVEKERLLSETGKATDIFETYDPNKTAKLLIGTYRMEGWPAEALERKYQKQEQRIHELDAADASMDLGAAGMTKTLFEFLFAKLCRAVITEGMLTAVFAALYMSGCEQTERTWQIVYATRRGRMVHREKLLAGFFYTMAVYSVTAQVSYMVFAFVWQLGDIWNTNMSTQFYTISASGMEVPFVPWMDVTLRGYLVAVVMLGAGVAVLFYLLAYLAGLLTKNSLKAFLVLFAAFALNFELIMLAGDAGRWGLYEAALWTPVFFWWSQPLWFSDMGIQAVIPWQECAVGTLCLVAAVLLLVYGFHYFSRKDLG